ncbi:MAG: ATP-binding protein [Candidatus Latescibacteria bacterium]|nr:ATP-binding protein [Candidatus Latescibacterota bacterium]
MMLFSANLGAIPAGVAAAPGGPVPYAVAILVLAAGLVWQIWRVRQRSRDLHDRQERVRGLESLLAISARIHAFRDSEHLLNEISQSVRESLGFRMVLLRIYNVADKVFEAKAFAGIDEEGIEYLRNTPVTLAEFRKLALPQFQVSNSYFLRHTMEGAEQAMAGGYVQSQGQRQEGEWDERDALIIPLTSPEGEIRGYLSVDDPIDRLIPGLQTIQMLELFAQQAATAIASAELYSRLHRQNQELTRSSDRLRYHNELKNNFVANVSHELRTPLTSIKAYSEALVHGRERMDDTAQGEFLRVIQSESEKLTGIVNNLLDLERMEREQVTFNRHQTDLVALVRGIEGSARSQAETKRIAFTMHVDREEILLGVDADLVRQLIRHLLDNAFKFTPSGGKVHLSVVDGVSSVRIVVEDNGIGVPDNKMTYIFDRFYQVDGSSTREHGGQGIGLAICRDIVTRHGGRIWGERVQPQGVRFNALLPRRDEIVRRGQNNGRNTVFSDVPEFAERLIHWVGELLRARVVALLLPDAGGEHLVVEAAMGLDDRVVQDLRLARGEGVAGRVWATCEPALGDAEAAGLRLAADRTAGGPGSGTLLSAPVMREGRVVGVVHVASRLDGRSFGVRDRLLLQAIAARLGHVLARVVVHQTSNREFGDLAQALRKSVAIRRARHDDLAEICHDICIETGRRMNLSETELTSLAFALQTYDLGLTGIPDDIIYKGPPLEPEEWEILQQHVHLSLQLISSLDAPGEVHDIVLHHHEHYDGSGYPRGLNGEDIPLGARLLMLADSLTAMLQGRPYRRAVTLEQALAEMQQRAGSQFCPRCLANFLDEAQHHADRIAAVQHARNLALPPPAVRIAAPADDEATDFEGELVGAASGDRYAS